MAELSTIVSDSPTAAANPTTVVMSEQHQSAFFEKIPLELRVKIYKYALDDIGLDRDWCWKEGLEEKHGCRIKGFELLRVCKKSFHEVIPYASSMPLVAGAGAGACASDDCHCLGFFSRFPPKFRHRLERVVLCARWWGEFRTEEIDQNQYPNLRVIELWETGNSPIFQMRCMAHHKYVWQLLILPDAPARYLDELFIQDVAFRDGTSERYRFLKTSGIVVRTQIATRIGVWEMLGGWPYSCDFSRRHLSEHPELMLEWNKDTVAILDRPDLRKEVSWYPERAAIERDLRRNPSFEKLRLFLMANSLLGEERDPKQHLIRSHGRNYLPDDGIYIEFWNEYDTSITNLLVTGEFGASED